MSAVLHPACPPKNAWCHQWTSFHIKIKKMCFLIILKWVLEGKKSPKHLLEMKPSKDGSVSDFLFQIKGNLFFFSFVWWMEKTRWHLFYPISLLPQKEKQNQKEKVLLCACVDMMLTDKTFFFFPFLCRLHSFLEWLCRLYSASSSPGFPFGHIDVASGSSRSYSHIIVAHLIISLESAIVLH